MTHSRSTSGRFLDVLIGGGDKSNVQIDDSKLAMSASDAAKMAGLRYSTIQDTLTISSQGGGKMLVALFDSVIVFIEMSGHHPKLFIDPITMHRVTWYTPVATTPKPPHIVFTILGHPNPLDLIFSSAKASWAFCAALDKAKSRLPSRDNVKFSTIVDELEGGIGIRAAVMDEKRIAYYATDEGIWYANLKSGEAPRLIVAMPHVRHLELSTREDVLGVLADGMQYLFPTTVLADGDWSQSKELCHIEFSADLLRAGRIGQDNCFVSVKNFQTETCSEITVLREAYMKQADDNSGRYTTAYFRFKHLRMRTLIKSFELVDTLMLAVTSDGLQEINLDVQRGKREASSKPAVSPGEPLLKEAGKPLAIVQIGEDYLCCYSELALFARRDGGARSRRNILMRWQAEPKQFIFRNHYLIVVSDALIEVYYVETGELIQVIATSRPSRILNLGAALVSDVFEPGSHMNGSGIWTRDIKTKLVLHTAEDINPMPVKDGPGDVLVTGVKGKGIELLEL